MAKKKAEKERISVTYTALVWAGIFLAVFGAVIASLGVGGVTTFAFKWKDVLELNSTNVGIIIMLTGVALALYQANHLPKGSGILMKTLAEKFSR